MRSYPSKNKKSIIPVVINTTLFVFLSLLHFYWTGGGRLWYDDVLPTSSNGMTKFNPGRAASLLVAFVLFIFALMTAGNLGLFDKYLKRKYFRYGMLLVAILFSIRAIGDFKFIGFFKIVKSTKFGINDTQIFSPLCLLISALSVFIFISTAKEK